MLYRKLENILKCNQKTMGKIPVSTKMQTGDWVQNSDQVDCRLQAADYRLKVQNAD